MSTLLTYTYDKSHRMTQQGKPLGWISSGQATTGGTVAVSLTASITPTAGNCLVLTTASIGGVTSVSTTGATTTWTTAVQSSGVGVGIYFCANVPGGITGVKIAGSDSQFMSMHVMEIAGLSGVINQTNSANGTGTSQSVSTSGSINASDLVVSVFTNSGNGTYGSPLTNWTKDPTDATAVSGDYTALTTCYAAAKLAAGTTTATQTNSASATWYGVIASFVAAESHSFSYNERNMLTQLVDNTGVDTTRTFAYNGLGERVYGVDGTTTPSYWCYDGAKLVYERQGASVWNYRQSPSVRGSTSTLNELGTSDGAAYGDADVFGNMKHLTVPSIQTDSYEQTRFGQRVAAQDFLGNRLQTLTGLNLMRTKLVSDEFFGGGGGGVYSSRVALLTYGTAMRGLLPVLFGGFGPVWWQVQPQQPPVAPQQPGGQGQDKPPQVPKKKDDIFGHDEVFAPCSPQSMSVRQRAPAEQETDSPNTFFDIVILGQNLRQCAFVQSINLTYDLKNPKTNVPRNAPVINPFHPNDFPLGDPPPNGFFWDFMLIFSDYYQNIDFQGTKTSFWVSDTYVRIVDQHAFVLYTNEGDGEVDALLRVIAHDEIWWEGERKFDYYWGYSVQAGGSAGPKRTKYSPLRAPDAKAAPGDARLSPGWNGGTQIAKPEFK